jgi:hypothetical protein
MYLPPMLAHNDPVNEEKSGEEVISVRMQKVKLSCPPGEAMVVVKKSAKRFGQSRHLTVKFGVFDASDSKVTQTVVPKVDHVMKGLRQGNSVTTGYR